MQTSGADYVASLSSNPACRRPLLPAPACFCTRRRIAVVTSEFHMPRTRATFDFIYGLAGRQLYGDAAWFDLHYCPGGCCAVQGEGRQHGRGAPACCGFVEQAASPQLQPEQAAHARRLTDFPPRLSAHSLLLVRELFERSPQAGVPSSPWRPFPACFESLHPVPLAAQ